MWYEIKWPHAHNQWRSETHKITHTGQKLLYILMLSIFGPGSERGFKSELQWSDVSFWAHQMVLLILISIFDTLSLLYIHITDDHRSIISISVTENKSFSIRPCGSSVEMRAPAPHVFILTFKESLVHQKLLWNQHLKLVNVTFKMPHIHMRRCPGSTWAPGHCDSSSFYENNVAGSRRSNFSCS